ncbi:hypothetical protein CUL08_22760 [Salmonella enterica]|nr:hypothetical protein [Salmonella enterica]
MKWKNFAYMFFLVPFFGKAATYIASDKGFQGSLGGSLLDGYPGGIEQVTESGEGVFKARWSQRPWGNYNENGANSWRLQFNGTYPAGCTVREAGGGTPYADVYIDWGAFYSDGRTPSRRLTNGGLYYTEYVDLETRGWAFVLFADAKFAPKLECDSGASEVQGKMELVGAVNGTPFSATMPIRYYRMTDPVGIKLSPEQVSCQANLGDTCKTSPVRLEYESNNISSHWVASLFTPSNGITYISDTGEKHTLTNIPQIIAQGDKTPPGGRLASGVFTVSNPDGNVGLTRHNINYTVTFD